MYGGNPADADNPGVATGDFGVGDFGESESGGYNPSWFEKALMSFYNNLYAGNSSLLGKNQSIMGQKTAENPTGAVTVTADAWDTAPGHGPQLTGGIVGNPGQPLGMTPGGYVNSPFGEFGPQQGMGYTQNSPWGEFGPQQGMGYAQNSPWGEFGPQQGMGYAPPGSPYGEFGPSQPGGYNMPGDIEGGGGEYYIRKPRLAYRNAYDQWESDL